MQNKFWQNVKAEQVFPPLFFLIIFIVGIVIFRDYGVSTDEWQQRQIGQASLNYLHQLFEKYLGSKETAIGLNPQAVFDGFIDRDYGVAFELPAEWLVSLLDLHGPEAYHFRHFLTFTVFYCSLIVMYQIAKERFNDWRYGLLAASFLILSPRIFGDAFYNDKDLVFYHFA